MPQLLDTAHFIGMINKLWDILNVRTTTIGKRKRDITRDPIRSVNYWTLDYLLQFADFLEAWEKYSDLGLTKETFQKNCSNCS